MNTIDEDALKKNLIKLGYEVVVDKDFDGKEKTFDYLYRKFSTVAVGYERQIVVSQTPYVDLVPTKNYHSLGFMSIKNIEERSKELKMELGLTALDLCEALNGVKH